MMSEEVLYTWKQPFDNYNGGDLDFGPDGLLYITFRAGGYAGDPLNNAQDLTDLPGDIIRIDVSNFDTTYTIPAGNPWFNPAEDTLSEIWASGFRNPFRFGFNRMNRDM